MRKLFSISLTVLLLLGVLTCMSGCQKDINKGDIFDVVNFGSFETKREDVIKAYGNDYKETVFESSLEHLDTGNPGGMDYYTNEKSILEYNVKIDDESNFIPDGIKITEYILEVTLKRPTKEEADKGISYEYVSDISVTPIFDDTDLGGSPMYKLCNDIVKYVSKRFNNTEQVGLPKIIFENREETDVKGYLDYCADNDGDGNTNTLAVDRLLSHLVYDTKGEIGLEYYIYPPKSDENKTDGSVKLYDDNKKDMGNFYLNREITVNCTSERVKITNSLFLQRDEFLILK